MKTFIFYTMDGYCESPRNMQVENMQVLGQEKGENQENALKNLLANNRWIVENGFNANSIICQQIVDDEMKNNIQSVLDYLWESEEKHYEEEMCDNHIFLILKKLKKLIY